MALAQLLSPSWAPWPGTSMALRELGQWPWTVHVGATCQLGGKGSFQMGKGNTAADSGRGSVSHASIPLSFYLSIRPPSFHMSVHSSKSLSLPSLLSPSHTTPIMPCQWLHFKGALRLNQSLLRPVSLSPSERALVVHLTERKTWVSRDREPGLVGDTELQAWKTWSHDPQPEMGGSWGTPVRFLFPGFGLLPAMALGHADKRGRAALQFLGRPLWLCKTWALLDTSSGGRAPAWHSPPGLGCRTSPEKETLQAGSSPLGSTQP